MIAILALLAQAATPVVPAVPAGGAASEQVSEVPDEVVVTARRRRCDLHIANRLISDREFKARAAEWAAGRPVRIVVPRGSSIRCEADIMFRLDRYGVTRAVFVEE